MEKGKKKSIMSDPAVAYNADIYRLKVKGVEALMGINDPQDLKNAVDYLKRKGKNSHDRSYFHEDINEMCRQIRLANEGKLQGKDAEDLLHEV